MVQSGYGMTSFIVKDEIFERIQPLEADYETLVARFAPRLFPNWQMWRWDPLVDGPEGRGKPDQVLVRADLKEWCVVEVELASHPESHFQNQFRVLAAARYGPNLVESLVTATDGIARADLERLVKRRPLLLCIADDDSSRLRLVCREHEFDLAVLQPYRGTLGSYALWRVSVPTWLSGSPLSAGTYVLDIATIMGGKVIARLPNSFPEATSIIVRHKGVLHETRVFRKDEGGRFVLLPATVTGGSNEIAVSAIDPSAGRYEVI